MRTARCLAALIKHGPSAYIFGGLNGHNLVECEKFAGNTWTPLPNMQQGRIAFTACSWGNLILLPCPVLTRVMQTVFSVHSAQLPDWDSHSTSFIADGKLFILAVRNQQPLQGCMARIHLGTEVNFRISAIDAPIHPRGSIPPMRWGRVFYCGGDNGNLVQFNIDTLVLSIT